MAAVHQLTTACPWAGNVHFPHGGIVRICGEPLYGQSVSREKFQATVFQGNGNAGADGLVRPVADQGAEHHYVFFHKEARGLHADHEVLRGQEFRGSLPYLQSGGDGPGGGFPGGQVVRHLHRNGNVPFLIRPERAAPLDAVRKIGAQLNVRGTVLLHVCVSLSGCKGITFCAFFIRSHLLHGRNRCGGGDCRSFSQYAACGFSADSIITGSDSCGSKAVDGSFFPPQQIAVVTVEQGLEVGLVRAAVLLRSGGRHFFQAEKAGFVQAPPDGLGDVRNIGACDIFQSLVIDGQGNDAVPDGFAVRPFDLNRYSPFFTGLVLGFARCYGRSQNLAGWRNQQFGGSRVKFPVSDGEGVHAHVGHVFPGQGAFHQGGLPVQRDQAAGLVFPGIAQEGSRRGRPDNQRRGAVWPYLPVRIPSCPE